MQCVDAIHLSSMTTQISFTVWTSMMNIHTFIYTTGNQAATKPTSNIEENNNTLYTFSIKEK